MAGKNTQVLMKQHPKGAVTEQDFEIVQRDIPKPGPDQVLVRNVYLSLDPYMRGRMDAVRSYAAHLNPGDMMGGGTVGLVIESNVEKLPVGTYVNGMLGWQEYAVAKANELRVLDPKVAPVSTALGVLGMPGCTAHYGLMSIGEPKAGETVVVSAASGAVGSVVGQIAKIKGCRVVGIAGGKDKCDYVVNELGFDACIDYKAGDMQAAFKAATPNRVDVYFENVGGDIMEMVFGRLNAFSRVAICGLISGYDGKPQAFTGMRHILVNRAKVQGFIISEHMGYWPGAIGEMAGWIKAGKLKYREDIAEGLTSAPKAFLGLLTGKNFGKQLVRVSPETL
ncbi:NADP-dependent oxidoreductase [Ferrovibrio terrae]|uniref:NADP-dependent oxidoreductase n=2 Tax=Ferrovibrio terrae TaxID=2594003 RepID=A0A516H346_9PROT|nr:NADP-dependent oxidoreductase [Ferrovibrio terrae]